MAIIKVVNTSQQYPKMPLKLFTTMLNNAPKFPNFLNNNAQRLRGVGLSKEEAQLWGWKGLGAKCFFFIAEIPTKLASVEGRQGRNVRDVSHLVEELPRGQQVAEDLE